MDERPRGIDDRSRDDRPPGIDEPSPADYKTACDGTGGLVRVRFVGGPHEGRSLYIDELELPEVIYTTASAARFEWWTARVQEAMANLPAGSDPLAPPVRHALHVRAATREPLFVAAGASPPA